ncbi:MAG: alginate export family protein, partial [Victivallales bacterium]|nr:alginate export family protein [Victivallales bacterium]
PLQAERAHFADASTSLHTAGLRFFGKYSIVDYSFEGAHQFGRGANGEHLDADMIDARLNIHLYDDSAFKPILGFNYTYFSGDDPTSSRFEGWNPLMTQCPLWGEELMPIMLNGMWSNLESLRTFMSFNVIKDLKFTLSATDYLADEPNSGVAGMGHTGGGDHVGLLLSAITSYKITDNMSVLGYVSHFMAGDYFGNGHDSYWFRLELNVAF